MDKIPHEMKRNGRPKDQNFKPDEYLFRRIPHELWSESKIDIDIDAIPLPDMSVNREKYGPPQWVRLAEEGCEDWAVIGFKVGDIPAEMIHLGVQKYTFAPSHVPLDENYPHSEVWCFRDGVHIQAKRNLDRSLHQRWREKLLWKVRTFLRPYE